MGYRCDKCNKHIQGPAGKGKQIPQNRVVVESRPVKFVQLYKDKEGRKKTSVGEGLQIVREVALCPACSEAFKV